MPAIANRIAFPIWLDTHGDAEFKFERLRQIAVAFSQTSRPDRAQEVLTEALRTIRREEYGQVERLLDVAIAYSQAGLTPDPQARKLLDDLCSGDAFKLTTEEEDKKRRAEEAADRFIRRWHETLDLNTLFDEQYVSNPKARRLNVGMFGGVYQHLSASGYGPGVGKGVNEALLRDAFFAFWTYYYLSDEYRVAFSKPDNEPAPIPSELKLRPPRLGKLDQKMIRRKQVVHLITVFKAVAAAYRKHLTAELFSTSRYLDNLRRSEAATSEYEKRFRISQGFPEYGVPDSSEVYYLQKGVFRFYFVEEIGKLKVLTLGFEL